MKDFFIKIKNKARVNDNQQNFIGTFTWKDGNVYKGQFNNNVKDGKGI